MNSYSLKNIVSHPSRNGYSMFATLLINNKPICRMSDIGDGSMPDFEIFDKTQYLQLVDDIENLPVSFITAYDSEVKIDLCIFIDLLNYALDTKTPFTLLAAS